MYSCEYFKPLSTIVRLQKKTVSNNNNSNPNPNPNPNTNRQKTW